MGTPNQSFDIQKLFKSSPSPSPTPPSPYTSNSSSPYPVSAPLPSYPPPPFPSQAPYPSYLHYSDHTARPYAPGPFGQPPPYTNQPMHGSSTSVSSPPLDGARLMALLTTHSTGDIRDLELPPSVVTSSSGGNSGIEASEAPPAIAPALPTAPPVSLALQSKVKSGKVSKGRVLVGERVSYDVGVVREEDQPQLEVSTITVYSSDPLVLLGRQIAVSKSYICYGLRAGTIRILNINTASRSLCKGHTQRVVDMAFVSSDVHVLASTSAEGRVYVRKITEGPSDQISDQILVGIQFTGDWTAAAQPRVCWHSRQDMLVVGIGKHVLTVDIRRAGGGTIEEPRECSMKMPIEGVCHLGTHEDEVTGLAVCPGTNRLASSSKDGTVRLWADTELAVLAPHGMQPVYSVNFMSAPSHPDHVVMLTGGPLNRELKLFSPAGTDGLNWMCIQTLGFISSGETKAEDEFFNQLVPVPNAGLILVSNAKKNAIYVVHLEFGPTGSSTRMDYLAEFSVKMPILSFTFTSDNLVDGEGVIQLYCIQTQAIQQHALDTAICLPPPQDGNTDNFPPPLLSSKLSDKGGLTASLDSATVTADKGKAFGESPSYDAKEGVQLKQEKVSADSDQIDKAVLSDGVLDDGEPGKSTDLKIDADGKEEKDSGTKKSSKPSQPHLITPSELMSMVARSKTEASAKADDEAKDVEVRVSLDRETGISDTMIDSFEERRRSFVDSSDATLDILESGDPDLQADADALMDSYTSHSFPEPELDDRTVGLTSDDIAIADLKEVPIKPADTSATSVSQSPAVSKGRKNKNKANAAVPLSGASSSVSPPEAEANGASGINSESLAAQIQTMQEALNQLIVLHKDTQKQFTMATVPMAKRMETTLGQRLEKIIKANVDAMLAKLQEDNLKREKVERERSQQFLAALAGSTKELPATVERIVKKELTTMGPSVAKLLSPAIEKAVSSGLSESQVLNEKALPQLEKAVIGKLETVVARHLQSQFQSTGRQALQDAMRACFEGSVVPSFERSCKSMFEQVDTAFQKGMAEHISHAQQQSAASQSALASSLQDSVSGLAQTLKSELAEGQRKMAAIAETRYSLKSSNAMPDKVVQAITLQHVEETLDPTIELSRLVSQGKLEEAFNKALSLSDVSIVSWLCNQVEPIQVFSTTPLPLTQGVLLSLVSQLGYDLGKDTAKKLAWIQGAALALNPTDPVLSPHMRPFLEQLYQNVHRQMMVNTSGELGSSVRLVVHLVNSLLTSCK